MSSQTETVSLSFALDVEEGWPPVGVECLPFQVTPDGYVAMSAPLFVKDLSAGDVIAVERDDVNGLVFTWRHVEKSGHTTIWLLRMKASATIEPALASLRELGCNTDALEAAGAYTIDVPATLALASVEAVLDQLDSAAFAVAFPSLRHEERCPDTCRRTSDTSAISPISCGSSPPQRASTMRRAARPSTKGERAGYARRWLGCRVRPIPSGSRATRSVSTDSTR